MGYEIKMYLVEKTDVCKENEATYAKVVGMVDLCKVGYDGAVSRVNRERPEQPELYFYADDGNTKITKDSYGEPIGVYDPSLVLAAVEKDSQDGAYRRFDLAIAILRAAIPQFDRLKVVFYGH